MDRKPGPIQYLAVSKTPCLTATEIKLDRNISTIKRTGKSLRISLLHVKELMGIVINADY